MHIACPATFCCSIIKAKSTAIVLSTRFASALSFALHNNKPNLCHQMHFTTLKCACGRPQTLSGGAYQTSAGFMGRLFAAGVEEK